MGGSHDLPKYGARAGPHSLCYRPTSRVEGAQGRVGQHRQLAGECDVGFGSVRLGRLGQAERREEGTAGGKVRRWEGQAA